MFVLYDVINHRAHIIWWTADKVRRQDCNMRFMVAELSNSLAEAVIEQTVPRSTVYEGIARYANG
jgi:hypothetical protein